MFSSNDFRLSNRRSPHMEDNTSYALSNFSPSQNALPSASRYYELFPEGSRYTRDIMRFFDEHSKDATDKKETDQVFPDFAGSLQHLKDVFSMPCSNDTLSLAIHRVGKTLLIDDAPVQLQAGNRTSVQNHRDSVDDYVNYTRHPSSFGWTNNTEVYARLSQNTPFSSKLSYFAIETHPAKIHLPSDVYISSESNSTVFESSFECLDKGGAALSNGYKEAPHVPSGDNAWNERFLDEAISKLGIFNIDSEYPVAQSGTKIIFLDGSTALKEGPAVAESSPFPVPSNPLTEDKGRVWMHDARPILFSTEQIEGKGNSGEAAEGMLPNVFIQDRGVKEANLHDKYTLRYFITGDPEAEGAFTSESKSTTVSSANTSAPPDLETEVCVKAPTYQEGWGTDRSLKAGMRSAWLQLQAYYMNRSTGPVLVEPVNLNEELPLGVRPTFSSHHSAAAASSVSSNSIDSGSDGALMPIIQGRTIANDPCEDTEGCTAKEAASESYSYFQKQPSIFGRATEWNFSPFLILLGNDFILYRNSVFYSLSPKTFGSHEILTRSERLNLWLENLMFSTQKVALCYYKNEKLKRFFFVNTDEVPLLRLTDTGDPIQKEYRSIKDTQEAADENAFAYILPEDETLSAADDFESSSFFDSNFVMEHGRRCLYFLQANCIREGGMYWLFRESNSSVAKLYDITDNSLLDVSSGCFALPAARLCFQVAGNLHAAIQSEEQRLGKAVMGSPRGTPTVEAVGSISESRLKASSSSSSGVYGSNLDSVGQEQGDEASVVSKLIRLRHLLAKGLLFIKPKSQPVLAAAAYTQLALTYFGYSPAILYGPKYAAFYASVFQNSSNALPRIKTCSGQMKGPIADIDYFAKECQYLGFALRYLELAIQTLRGEQLCGEASVVEAADSCFFLSSDPTEASKDPVPLHKANGADATAPTTNKTNWKAYASSQQLMNFYAVYAECCLRVVNCLNSLTAFVEQLEAFFLLDGLNTTLPDTLQSLDASGIDLTAASRRRLSTIGSHLIFWRIQWLIKSLICLEKLSDEQRIVQSSVIKENGYLLSDLLCQLSTYRYEPKRKEGAAVVTLPEEWHYLNKVSKLCHTHPWVQALSQWRCTVYAEVATRLADRLSALKTEGAIGSSQRSAVHLPVRSSVKPSTADSSVEVAFRLWFEWLYFLIPDEHCRNPISLNHVFSSEPNPILPERFDPLLFASSNTFRTPIERQWLQHPYISHWPTLLSQPSFLPREGLLALHAFCFEGMTKEARDPNTREAVRPKPSVSSPVLFKAVPLRSLRSPKRKGLKSVRTSLPNGQLGVIKEKPYYYLFLLESFMHPKGSFWDTLQHSTRMDCFIDALRKYGAVYNHIGQEALEGEYSTNDAALMERYGHMRQPLNDGLEDTHGDGGTAMALLRNPKWVCAVFRFQKLATAYTMFVQAFLCNALALDVTNAILILLNLARLFKQMAASNVSKCMRASAPYNPLEEGEGTLSRTIASVASKKRERGVVLGALDKMQNRRGAQTVDKWDTAKLRRGILKGETLKPDESVSFSKEDYFLYYAALQCCDTALQILDWVAALKQEDSEHLQELYGLHTRLWRDDTQRLIQTELAYVHLTMAIDMMQKASSCGSGVGGSAAFHFEEGIPSSSASFELQVGEKEQLLGCREEALGFGNWPYLGFSWELLQHHPWIALFVQQGLLSETNGWLNIDDPSAAAAYHLMPQTKEGVGSNAFFSVKEQLPKSGLGSRTTENDPSKTTHCLPTFWLTASQWAAVKCQSQSMLCSQHLLKALQLFENLKCTREILVTQYHLGLFFTSQIVNAVKDVSTIGHKQMHSLKADKQAGLGHFREALKYCTTAETFRDFVKANLKMAELWVLPPGQNVNQALAILISAEHFLLGVLGEMDATARDTQGIEIVFRKSSTVKKDSAAWRNNAIGIADMYQSICTLLKQILQEKIAWKAAIDSKGVHSSLDEKWMVDRTKLETANIETKERYMYEILSKKLSKLSVKRFFTNLLNYSENAFSYLLKTNL